MKTYVADPETGQPYPTQSARSVKAGASPYARCQSCWSTGPMLRREGEGSLLPLAHARGCRFEEAERFDLLADLEGAAENGDGLVVATRRPTPSELSLLESLSHDVDPDSTVTVTVEGGQRRRTWIRTDDVVVTW